MIDSSAGPVLVYEAARGELVHFRSSSAATRRRRTNGSRTCLPSSSSASSTSSSTCTPTSPRPVGFACDLYDSCLVVDFADASLKVVDLDTYRRGPSRNDMDRIFGADRFMAPEDYELGAVIDQRTTVFTLGRLVWHFGTAPPTALPPSAAALPTPRHAARALR